MQTSQNGRTLIKKFEGCVLQVYLDCVGVKTLGYGHTGADVNALPVGARISQEQADEYLKKDLEKFERNVNRYYDTYKWNQNEFDALVSFAYNVGSIDQLVDNGRRNRGQIADAMLLYNKAKKQVIPGLVNRRKAERALFLSGAITASKTYEIGKTYKIVASGLYIREAPHGNKLKYETITIDARKHSRFDNLGYSILEKGTKVTCKGVVHTDNSTWIKIPSGFICAVQEGDVYIE